MAERVEFAVGRCQLLDDGQRHESARLGIGDNDHYHRHRRAASDIYTGRLSKNAPG
jgi:hypothetical protein